MATLRIATRPPLNSNTMAMDESTIPQTTLILRSGFKSPFRENIATTKLAESADVTKNVTINNVAKNEIAWPNGKCDKVTNNPTATSPVMASAMFSLSMISKCRAVPPNTANQRQQKAPG